MLREAVLSVVFFIITQHVNVFKTTWPRSTGVNAGTENPYVRLAYFMGIDLGCRGKLEQIREATVPLLIGCRG